MCGYFCRAMTITQFMELDENLYHQHPPKEGSRLYLELKKYGLINNLTPELSKDFLQWWLHSGHKSGESCKLVTKVMEKVKASYITSRTFLGRLIGKKPIAKEDALRMLKQEEFRYYGRGSETWNYGHAEDIAMLNLEYDELEAKLSAHPNQQYTKDEIAGWTGFSDVWKNLSELQKAKWCRENLTSETVKEIIFFDSNSRPCEKPPRNHYEENELFHDITNKKSFSKAWKLLDKIQKSQWYYYNVSRRTQQDFIEAVKNRIID